MLAGGRRGTLLALVTGEQDVKYPITREMVASLLDEIGDDGHTIWDPVVLKEFPTGFQVEYTEKLESNGTGKGSITSTETGELVQELEGVYGLHVLGGLCHLLNLETHGFSGRGYRAGEYTRVLREWCASK